MVPSSSRRRSGVSSARWPGLLRAQERASRVPELVGPEVRGYETFAKARTEENPLGLYTLAPDRIRNHTGRELAEKKRAARGARFRELYARLGLRVAVRGQHRGDHVGGYEHEGSYVLGRTTETIDLYYWPTPNGWKISIALEELGLPYNVVPVNIGTGDQFRPEFLRISPNNRMPAIVDPEGPDGEPISLFETGAILLYLAEKTGKLFPEGPRERHEAMQWLMFQMGGVGPMLGQAHHFRQYAPEKIPYAVDRYTNEAARLYGVMDRRLAEAEYFAGDEYTVVDIAIYPWVVPHENQGQDLNDFPDLKRWYDAVSSRPAVQRGLEVGAELRQSLNDLDEESRNKLFGNKPSGK